MREYSQVRPRFWIAGTGRQMRGDPDAQRVAFYLMTCPNHNMTGLYYLPVPTIAHEVGIPFEGASKGLRRVCQLGFAEYDEENEIVWVKEMLREQLGDSLKPADKKCLGIAAQIEPLRNTPLFNKFLDRYKDTHCIPLERGSEAPPKPLRSTEQEQETEQETERDLGALADSDPNVLDQRTLDRLTSVVHGHASRLYQAKRGIEYNRHGANGRGARAIAEHVHGMSGEFEENLAQGLKNYYAADDPYVVQADYSLSLLSSQWNRWHTPPKVKPKKLSAEEKAEVEALKRTLASQRSADEADRKAKEAAESAVPAPEGIMDRVRGGVA